MSIALVIGEALIDIVERASGADELVGGSPANVALGLARQYFKGATAPRGRENLPGEAGLSRQYFKGATAPRGREDLPQEATLSRQLFRGAAAPWGRGSLPRDAGLSHQGYDVRLLTRLGRDARGERIAAEVTASGAAIDEASWTDAATSTARARLRTDGSAEYEFAIDWTVPVAPLDGVGAVHTGSIALFLEPGGTAVLETLRVAAAAGGVLVTVDPNIRPALVGDRESARARFEDAAASADLVKLSDEDAAWLYPGVTAADVLHAIAALGPRIVVMTRGGEGAVGLGPGGLAEVSALPVSVADTIGAGDAYMASLISSALDDDAVFDDEAAFRTALRRAAVMAGITVSRAGANPPTRAEVDEAE